jgi:hypothetical protein
LSSKMVVYSAAPAEEETAGAASIATAIAALARNLVFIALSPLLCALFNP